MSDQPKSPMTREQANRVPRRAALRRRAAESPPMLPPACAPISVERSWLNAGTRVMRDPDASEPMPAPAGCTWVRPYEGWIDLRRWRQ